MKLWRFVMSHPLLYKLLFRSAALLQGPLLEDGKLKRLPPPFDGWTENRDFPPIASRSFRDIWADMEKS